jgi:hypothetical protein
METPKKDSAESGLGIFSFIPPSLLGAAMAR